MTISKHPIMVTVITEYLDEESRPEEGRYVFAYHITIKNQSVRSAKLLTRHWIIIDSNQERREVHGEGVVGKQPIILSGDHYEYTSAVVLDTPVGTMEGSYQFVDDCGVAFNALVKPFLLSTPNLVH
ncbi:MAG: Co2+/Mg2+ efflux protein ApaG [Proteobacteria bacterium]|jgi:ApaG protein|nr:Co2+/Mg2+ efflux protein ApaG [Pseudomonadota bacterium]MDA1351346.1 Co2+/Mg2+ efflux protein ApaG [Pseudomonadota bacterium]|tara:strand:+ start:1775 stop:2155 length:381 start_codon:yes stop_codon:yes gene_type:complete